MLCETYAVVRRRELHLLYLNVCWISLFCWSCTAPSLSSQVLRLRLLLLILMMLRVFDTERWRKRWQAETSAPWKNCPRSHRPSRLSAVSRNSSSRRSLLAIASFGSAVGARACSVAPVISCAAETGVIEVVTAMVTDLKSVAAVGRFERRHYPLKTPSVTQDALWQGVSEASETAFSMASVLRMRRFASSTWSQETVGRCCWPRLLPAAEHKEH